jgi:transcriptional regulator with XRE-family HTH domain
LRKTVIAKALKVIRQYHNLNQTQLAAKLAISTSYLSELESGRKEPTLALLQKYASIFDVPLSSLVVFFLNLDWASHNKAKSFVAKKMLKILDWVADHASTDETSSSVEKIHNV